MRMTGTSMLIALLLSIPTGASQTRGPAAPAGDGSKACAILTRDLVLPLTQNPKILDLIPPEEEAMSNGGSACENGAVRLQLYPPRTMPATTPPKDFQPVSGVGDQAYFHNNRDRYAELAVWSGVRYFTLQVSVPTGSTAEAIKPKTIALAHAIIGKLK